jgi:hypothetical protein
MGIGVHEKPNKGATDIWLTPLEIIINLGNNFDLDPCGQQDHQTAKEIYSENGLDNEWHGRVWLNPPYSQVGVWLDRLAEHGNGVALVFARTDTRWAQKIMPKASQVFFLAKRIKFLNSDKTNPKWTSGAPSMFLNFGPIQSFRNFSGIEFRPNEDAGGRK